MDDRLGSFIAHGLPETVAVGDDERTFVKDLTPASLPWIESYAVSQLPSPALASAPANQRLAEDLMRYVGESFIRTLGGSWQHDADGPDHGMPFVRVQTPSAESGAETTDVSVLGLLMTALQRRTGDVFVSVLLQTADADSDAGGTEDRQTPAEGGSTTAAGSGSAPGTTPADTTSATGGAAPGAAAADISDAASEGTSADR